MLKRLAETEGPSLFGHSSPDPKPELTVVSGGWTEDAIDRIEAARACQVRRPQPLVRDKDFDDCFRSWGSGRLAQCLAGFVWARLSETVGATTGGGVALPVLALDVINMISDEFKGKEPAGHRFVL